MLQTSLGARARHHLILTKIVMLAATTSVLAACPLGSDATSVVSQVPITMSIVVQSNPATGAQVIGTTRQYAIQVRNLSNVILTADTTATWSILGTAGIATISAKGLATCVTLGTATVHAVGPINAAGTNLTADASLDCVGFPAATIVLTPSTLTTAVGGTVITTATFRDASGLVTTNGCPLTFTFTDASGFSTVSSSGTVATLTGRVAGRTSLRAACTTGTVPPAFLARVQITSPPLNIARIVSTFRFLRFAVSTGSTSFRLIETAQDASGATVATTSMVWAISGGAAASIDQGGNVTVSPTAGQPPLAGGAHITVSVGGMVEHMYLTYGDAGTIRGQVTSALGQDVGGTTAKATNTATGLVTTAGPVTNDGYVLLVGLAPGTYTVEIASAEGVRQTLTNVVVVSGQTNDVTFTPSAQRASN